jgi:hypothetical protein
MDQADVTAPSTIERSFMYLRFLISVVFNDAFIFSIRIPIARRLPRC